jgi:hypothetical protein
MKKIYFSLALFTGILQISNAQLSLTKAANEPVIGDIYNTQDYDSTTTIPKNTGAGQSWNFNSFLQKTSYSNNTFTTVASTPNSSLFSGSTLAVDQGGGSYQYFKVTPTNFELSGLQYPTAVFNFSNTAIFYVWPVNFGYSSTDVFGGTTTTSVTSTMAGSITINATGAGTVTMPGGLVLTNCLQLINTYTISLGVSTYSQSAIEKEYQYYHSTNKFPVLTIHYSTVTTGSTVTKSYKIQVNTAVVAAIKTNQLNDDFSIFPNPANETITISLSNPGHQMVSATLTNMLGQVVKTERFGNGTSIHTNLNITDLQKGMYLLNLMVGDTNTIRKIIVE